ncbi:MAG: cysteine desulfurase, partial [Ignavibacteriaceae bacterium]|nr:cysteine desulfurase [Ignavibacteriaceae bacterium]
EANLNKGNHIITSEIEHSAVIATCKNLEKYGVKVSYLRTDSSGLIDLDELRDSITKNTILVSIQSSNNEIGTIQHVEDISNICRSNNIIFHSDVTQSVGKHVVDYSLFDLFSLSAHKFYGPKGIGTLGISHNLKHSDIAPQILGGNQEFGLRSGTLNVPLIVGLGKAIELIENNKSEISEMVEKRDLLYNGILTKTDNIYLNGDKKRRLYSNLNFYIDGVSSTNLIKHCAELCFSTGATCSSALGQRSRVLKAIGLTNEQIDSSIRLSVGRFTTFEEIEQTINIFTNTINKLREKGQK